MFTNDQSTPSDPQPEGQQTQKSATKKTASKTGWKYWLLYPKTYKNPGEPFFLLQSRFARLYDVEKWHPRLVLATIAMQEDKKSWVGPNGGRYRGSPTPMDPSTALLIVPNVNPVFKARDWGCAPKKTEEEWRRVGLLQKEKAKDPPVS
ncbi:GL11951 [Drosophila persimilis]|uniref:GL11951 n=1 Tax=Drosophila persimilis TaxID=7234 RepID=B4GLY2_DROPE|nr:GL11951 [Drosophila persimilis]